MDAIRSERITASVRSAKAATSAGGYASPACSALPPRGAHTLPVASRYAPYAARRRRGSATPSSCCTVYATSAALRTIAVSRRLVGKPVEPLIQVVDDRFYLFAGPMQTRVGLPAAHLMRKACPIGCELVLAPADLGIVVRGAMAFVQQLSPRWRGAALAITQTAAMRWRATKTRKNISLVSWSATHSTFASDHSPPRVDWRQALANPGRPDTSTCQNTPIRLLNATSPLPIHRVP